MEEEPVAWSVMGLYWWLLIVLSNFSTDKMSKVLIIYHTSNTIICLDPSKLQHDERTKVYKPNQMTLNLKMLIRMHLSVGAPVFFFFFVPSKGKPRCE